MKIDKPLLHKIAHLARLELESHNEDRLLQDLNNIVHWAEKLQELNTDDVAPLITMSEEENIWQEDQPCPSLAHDRALKNAPKKDSNYFRVPQVKK